MLRTNEPTAPLSAGRRRTTTARRFNSRYRGNRVGAGECPAKALIWKATAGASCACRSAQAKSQGQLRVAQIQLRSECKSNPRPRALHSQQLPRNSAPSLAPQRGASLDATCNSLSSECNQSKVTAGQRSIAARCFGATRVGVRLRGLVTPLRRHSNRRRKAATERDRSLTTAGQEPRASPKGDVRKPTVLKIASPTSQVHRSGV